MPEISRIRRAYDGSLLSYRSLRVAGWGTLENLGYYPLYALPLLASGFSWFQRKLARESIRLLDPRPGQRILDVAMGKGWTSDRIGQSGAQVLGIDLLPENVKEARRRFPRGTFAVADATQLSDHAGDVALSPGSFDRILCLEAAFSFGAKGRYAFLERSFRLLRPGGRLVIVDFTWPDEHPEDIARHDPHGFVRETWQFEEFEPLARYRDTARALGFRERQIVDWSTLVTKRFAAICLAVTGMCQNPIGRFVYALFRPGLFRIWDSDFAHLLEVVRAHRSVQRVSNYTALVFEKPRNEKSPT